MCKQCGDVVPPSKGKKPRLFCDKNCGIWFRAGKPFGKHYQADAVTCPVCQRVVPNRIKPGRTKIYCSKACGDRHTYSLRYPAKLKENRSCAVCGSIFETALSKQRFCSESCRLKETARKASARWRENYAAPENWNYICDECGILVERSLAQGRVTKGRYGRFCRVCAKSREKARYRAKTAKRQGIVKPNNIRYEQVFERDGGVCWLCQMSVDSSLPRTSKLGGTLDHIVPISKGGDDSLENIKLAHWICNNRKSNKLIEGLNA